MRKFTKISMLLIFCLSAAVVWSQTSSMSHPLVEKVKTEKIVKYDPANEPPTDQGGEDIANAVAITAPYTNTGSTATAIDDYDEVCPYGPHTSPDVVYSYTPAVDEALDIDLLGSAYDTKLFVYEDLATPGAPYACNDDYHPDYTSALFGLAVYTGHTYYIVIDGYGGASGTYSIALAAGSLIPPPPNDECGGLTPTTLLDGVPVVFTGDNTGATVSCSTGPFGPNGEAWEAFTLTGVADVVLDYCGSGGGTPWGNAWLNLMTSCPCGPTTAGATYETTTCADGNVTMTWAGLGAGTYYYPVMLDPTLNSIGPYTINVVATYSTALPNYTCADAIAVTPGTYTAPGPSTGAGAANICYTGATNAVWYSFTPAVDGQITVGSCLGGADTRLSIYTGTCGALVCHANTDDDCDLGSGSFYAAELTGVAVVGGTTYYIEWDDNWSTLGFDWYLDFSVPGATCDDAVTVIEGTHTCPGPVVGLGGAANNCFTSATDAYWYAYTPAADGLVTIESTTIGGDTRLSFYDGTCAVLNCVASDDDGGTGYLSLISNVPVISGTTYYIEWDDRWETAGFDWYLTFTGGGLPIGSVCDDPLVISSLPYTTSDNTSNYGDDYSDVDNPCTTAAYYLNGDDVVYSYTPAADECVDITLTNTGTYVGLYVFEGCPFTTCVDNDLASGGNPSLTGVNLTNGTTYYIVISTWPSPQSTAYDLEIINCPDCPAPTNQTETNITSVGADLNWDFAIDSFFDIFVVPEFDPPPGPGTIPTISNTPGNSVTWDGGMPSTSYDWYVRTDCGFTGPTVDYFWMAMDVPGGLIPGLSGGLPVDDLGEDGLWWEYPLAPDPWWNIWFYNGPIDFDNMKLVKMGFWIQSLNGIDPGDLNYVINWSNDLWTGPGFPTELDEAFIVRSPINVMPVLAGAPQWVELTYLIEDYCPEWVSIDLWGENIQILEIGDPPPAGSPLLEWWVAGSPGGILVHECLPEPMGNNSTWTGPSTFTTLGLPPANDLCANAEVVICDNSYPGTTADATWDDVGTCGTTNTQPGVWYVFTGIGDMVSADLCGTSWDTKLGVFEEPCTSLVCVDGNDDYCGLQSRVDWYAELGVDYYILVHQYGATGGAFTLNIDCNSPLAAIWEGDNFNNDWFDADNWDAIDVPGAATDVTIPPGLTYYPTIDRTAVCNNMLVGSDAAGDASLLDNDFLTVGGTVSVERYITSGVYHSYSPSVSGATAGIFKLGSSGPDVYLYSHNEVNHEDPYFGYFEIVPVGTPLNVMDGYAVWLDGATWTFDQVGGLNTGLFSKNLTRTGTGDNTTFAGFNYVGNPYPSFIDWDATAGWTKTNLDASTYVENAGGWAVWTNPGPGVNGGAPIVSPGQGFFVRVSEFHANGALTMDNNVRTHTSTPFLKSDASNYVKLVATGNDKADEMVIRFDENATILFDLQYDGMKLSASDITIPQLYSISNVNLAYNALPEVESVQLGFEVSIPGEYTISALEIADIPSVWLEDTFTGIYTDLTTDSYTFIASVDDDASRFIVHFAPLSTPENGADLYNIYSYNKDVYVAVPESTKGDIVIFNMMGQEVASTKITDVLNVITLDKSAYYVVKVLSNESVVTKKVFVK